MIPRTPEPHIEPEGPRQTSGRRACIRFPRRLEMLWQFLGIATSDLTSASVFDLSEKGVGLIADREFVPETVLFLRLPTATMGWNTHLVRVRHCARQEDGSFKVGCSFVKPLTAAQLQALLS